MTLAEIESSAALSGRVLKVTHVANASQGKPAWVDVIRQPQYPIVPAYQVPPSYPLQVQYLLPPKSRTAYILLGLFLGCLGIHNFYAGYTGKGIAQLLITLLIGWLIIPWLAVALWALIEICVVSTDSQNRPMQ